MLLSLVIPVFNEEEVLPSLLATLKQVLTRIPCESEIVFVNDGSSDGTGRILRGMCMADRRVKMLGFSRNFGHQMAITAGMDFANGDAVVIMDADLQDPPEVLIEMVRLYQEGYEVVSAQRIARRTDTLFKRATAAGFYWIMRKLVDKRLVPQVGDFRLFSRAAINTLGQFREQHRFMRGMVAWCGLKEAIVPFDRQARAAGTTKYSTLKMLRFAWTAISSFSGMPLRMTLSLGAGFTLIGMLYFVYAAYSALVLKIAVPGWASLVFLQVTFSGATLLALGVMGDYVARIYEEIKGRPLYILNDSANLDMEAQHVSRAVVLPKPAPRERWAKLGGA
jgi:polyisoprenyl-phosphate glycosyltransferase